MIKKFMIIVEVMLILSASRNARAEDLRDVLPPVYLPQGHYFWIVVLIILLLAAVMFVFLSQRKKAAREVSAVRKHPWEIALERLAQLEKEKLHQQDGMDRFYVALSDIIRRYFEDQLLLRAPEMTTEEFLESLKVSSKLTVQHKDTVKEFLLQSDMVKFARHTPGVPEAEAGLKLARKLIEDTKTEEMISSR
jgi:hypothetical protein